jgi:hypothetical protein
MSDTTAESQTTWATRDLWSALLWELRKAMDGGFLRQGLIAFHFWGFLQRANNNIDLSCNHNRIYVCDPMFSKQNRSKNDPPLDFCGDPANSPNSGARLAPPNPTQPKVSGTEDSPINLWVWFGGSLHSAVRNIRQYHHTPQLYQGTIIDVLLTILGPTTNRKRGIRSGLCHGSVPGAETMRTRHGRA